MINITVTVDAPEENVIEIKETLAMYLERYGDTRVNSISFTEKKQLRMNGI